MFRDGNGVAIDAARASSLYERACRGRFPLDVDTGDREACGRK
jgi:hypothetical protein